MHFSSHLFLTLSNFAYTRFYTRPFYKLDSGHLEYVFDCLRNNTTQIRNIRAYLLTALYNAPTTINNYYQAAVQHDFGP